MVFDATPIDIVSQFINLITLCFHILITDMEFDQEDDDKDEITAHSYSTHGNLQDPRRAQFESTSG